MTDDKPRYSLDTLARLAETPVRTVRYYIQTGLVDRPEGAGRGAHYSSRHLEQLLAVRKWQRAGLSLDRIRELLREETEPPPPPRRRGAVEVWSHLVIDDGVELMLEPTRAGLSPEAVRRLAREVTRIYEHLREEEEPSS